MNLATLLQQTVTPLSAYTPEEPVRKKRKNRTPPAGDNRNRHNKALKCYQAVMGGNGWMTTTAITEGVCAWNAANGFRSIQCSYPTLRKWSKAGTVELRTKDDVKWGRKARFEWRWAE